MTTTLLEICQDAVSEIGEVEIPGSIVGNANQTAVWLLALAKRDLRFLGRRHDWQILVTEHTFNTADADGDYALPSDFRFVLADTVWDRTNRWEVVGPLSAQEWQARQAWSLSATTRSNWRIRGNEMLIWPTPTSVRSIYYEYVSGNFCTSSGGTGQENWEADTDIAILNPDLLTLGLRWRFLKRFGLAYEDDQNEYMIELEKEIARDGGRAKKSLTGSKKGAHSPFGEQDFSGSSAP